jgi:hypothetical protein
MQYRTPTLAVLGIASRLIQGQEKNDPNIADGHPIYHSTDAAYDVDE